MNAEPRGLFGPNDNREAVLWVLAHAGSQTARYRRGSTPIARTLLRRRCSARAGTRPRFGSVRRSVDGFLWIALTDMSLPCHT